MQEERQNKGSVDRISTAHTVLVAEDDEALLQLIQKSLRRAGFHTEGVLSGAEAVDWIANNPVTLLLLDYRLPDMSGEQVIETLAKGQGTVPFIVMTGHGDERIAVDMMKRGARDYLVKDFTFSDRLPQVIGRTLEELATEEKLAEAERALRESEERFRSIYAESPIAIELCDSDSRLIGVNKACLDMFGLSDTLDIKWYSLFNDPHVPDETKAKLRRGETARYEVAFDFEEVKRRKLYETTRSGVAYLDVLTSPLGLSEGGSPKGYLLQIQDITERKRAEEELKAAEEYARNLIDSSLDMIISVDQERRIVEFNPAAQEAFGYSKAEVLGKHADILYADLTEGLKVHEAARRTGRFIGEIVDRRKNGKTFPSSLTASAMQDAKGNFLGVMGVSLDITERKRAEEDAARHHRELAALHNVLISITQTLDLEEVLREIVSQAGAALDSEYTSIVTVNQDGSPGIDSKDFQGIPPLSVRARPEGVTRRIITSGRPVVVDDVDADESTNPAIVAAGIKSYGGVPIKTKDATIGVLFVHSRQRNAFADRLGLLMGFASQAAIAIENARLYQEASTVGALREADRLKTELLANVSHELRTPLTSIKGYCTSMLRYYERLTDDDKRDSLHEINQASDKLTGLIENLLQLSRLEAAGLHANKEPTKIASIIGAAVADTKPKAMGHRFVTHVQEPLPVVEADPVRIRQVLDNLLSNAAKYSSEGTDISVRCEQKGEELVVSVRDQGIGIAPEDMDRVFDRFYQVSPGLCQNGGGAGLGL
ncbi:MAG: PAS domain S-box protein, partial [Dehalococcoidia bacterium]|nr:PAS domain S-box protein [Dehalococcoidia bacterium]